MASKWTRKAVINQQIKKCRKQINLNQNITKTNQMKKNKKKEHNHVRCTQIIPQIKFKITKDPNNPNTHATECNPKHNNNITILQINDTTKKQHADIYIWHVKLQTNKCK